LERLVTTSDAAKLLNLSIQGIHYRIKKGQLRSKKENGRVFVYIDEQDINTNKLYNNTNSHSYNHYEEIIKIKDEQIAQYKSTLKMVVKQYKNEIKRLDKNQDKMAKVFKSEIQLLQKAFNEMRSIYQIEHQNSNKIEFINLDDFFILMKKYGKTDIQIKNIILQRIKVGDKRFIFDKDTKYLHILKSDFKDLI